MGISIWLNVLVVLLAGGLYKKFTLASSFVDGKLSSYLTLKVFPTDIILLLLLAFCLLRGPKLIRSLKRNGVSRFFVPALLLILFLISNYFSAHPEIALYSTFRLLLYLFFYFLVSTQIRSQGFWGETIWLLAVVILVESTLAVTQFLKQSFVLGFFPWGEPTLTASQLGAPLVNWLGDWKLRSFGTFPHPNVLGGFLAITLIWIVYLIEKHFSEKKKLIFLVSVFTLGITGLFLTFSQGAWGAFLLGLTLMVMIKVKDSWNLFRVILVVALSTLWLIISIFIFNLPLDQTSDHRLKLAEVSLNLISRKPWWGVGLGNFVYYSLPDFREPVHNLFLLVLSEGGIFTFLTFSLMIGRHLNWAWRSQPAEERLMAVSLIQLIFLGFFDHYLWTSNQGSLLFWLVLGLVNRPRGSG